MAVPLLLIGTALQIAGRYGANMAQAQSELQNAQFYEEQAQFQQFTKQREIGLIARNYAAQYGQQAGVYAAAGVDVGSGSASLMLGGTLARHAAESLAAAKKYDLEMRLTRLRGAASQAHADTLSSPGFNLIQAGTTALSAYTDSLGSGGKTGGGTDFAGSGPMSPGGGITSIDPTLSTFGGVQYKSKYLGDM